ncbi:MAG: sulfite exporter TauE/SafE family protein [Candidatus Aenigmatarchaeota archaeon]|nr:MAG: sulfite exporter TauE/SafE family protein [Candidatus Aenigmarchaeota archaeon]
MDPVELALSFGLGFAANLNPCVLPLYPGFLSYISSQPGIENKKRFTRVSGFLVLAGVLIFMSIVGFITASLGLSITGFVSIASPIAFGVLVILGIILLAGIDLGKLVPKTNTKVMKNPYASALAFGFMYGPIVIPCNAPLVFAVFAYSVGIGGFIGSFLPFLFFGLGLGVPLLIISFLSAARGSWLIKNFVKYHKPINRIAGALLVILGLYELIFVFRVFG